MAQSSFSGTSLWLLLVGGPTLLFTHCLPCWFDNLSLWPKCKPWKIVDTSSALQTRGLVTTVSCSSSDLSNEIKEECRASKSCMLFSSSLTTSSLFSSFLLILCLLFCSCWYCSYEPSSIFFLLEAKFWVIPSKIRLSKHRESFLICSTSWTSLQAVLWCQSLEIHFLCLNTIYIWLVVDCRPEPKRWYCSSVSNALCFSPLMRRDILKCINSNLTKHNSSIWTNFAAPWCTDCE